jgi:hypothetical protein
MARSIGLSSAPLRLYSAEVHQEDGGSQRRAEEKRQQDAYYAWLSRRWLTVLAVWSSSPFEARERPRAALQNMMHWRQAPASGGGRRAAFSLFCAREGERRPYRPGRTVLLPGIKAKPDARSTPLWQSHQSICRAVGILQTGPPGAEAQD